MDAAGVHRAGAPAAGGSQAVRPAARTLGEALRTWQWYSLWLLLFLNTTAGIAVISQAAPMFQEITAIIAGARRRHRRRHLDRQRRRTPAVGVAVGRGRPADGVPRDVRAAGDHLRLMPAAHSLTLFAALTVAVLLCYGGGFGTMPAFAADYFGAEHVGSIYGLMLTAWGVAGAVGPTLIAAMRERSGGYDSALRSIAVLMLVSAIIPLLVNRPRSA